VKRWLLRFAALLAVALLVLTFVNASWLAPTPRGRVQLIAHRGVYQAFDHRGVTADTCTARRIEPPYHPFLVNTLGSLERAKSLGAAMVELDVAPTKDGHLVVFHDWTLDCRTNGHGEIREHALAEIKALDAGYGYTADGGRTFPFRGKGVGMIPTLEQYLRVAGDKRLLFNFKSGDPAEADQLAAALKAAGRDAERIGDGFYGGPEAGPVARIRQIYPKAWTFSKDSAKACTKAYAVQGWLGLIPAACRNGTLVVPLDYQWAFPGWPDRAIARMESVGAHVLMVGPQRGGDSPMGIDLPEQLGEVPASFNGYLFVDDIWNVAPALYPSLDHRSPEQQEAADRGLARRRGMP
jgi:glycerophosphoryl diester phosphodiesterase